MVASLLPTAPAYDEAHDADGRPREHYGWLLDALEGRDLVALRAALAEDLAGRGVAFGEDPFEICPVPRLIPAGEWRALERGLVQRVRALQAFLADVYAEREIVEHGVVPAEVVEHADYFEPLLASSGFRCPIAVAGLDVVRDEAGRYRVLEDNLRTPSGVAYAVAAREALDRHLPCPRPRLDVRDGYRMLARALRAAAPEGRPDPFVVLLSDGPGNSAWYEHREIARELEIPLVLPRDLRRAREGLFANVRGVWHRVDVVYRRTNEDRLTHPDGTPTEVARLLIEPVLAGTVGCVNAFGAGVADDKLTHAYVEDMIRFYLGEEPLIGSVPSHDLGVEDVRAAVLDRVDEVVLKPRAESGGHGVMIGPRASPAEREAAADAVRQDPDGYVAQETVWLSSVPTVAPDGGLVPRHVDLRAFVFVAGDEVRVLPGGLTRVALEPGSLVVNSSQRGGGKDTWVLA